MAKSAGIHHITAIAGDPKRHVAFYRGTLGLRLVKRTVNFDVPDTWHLYWGDEAGTPGTALTFFVWQDLPPGRHGAGEVQDIAFAVPPGSIGFWKERLAQKGITAAMAPARFGEQVLAFSDADGHRLEIVASEAAGAIAGWAGGEVPAAHAIRGFHGATIDVRDPARTAGVLTEVFGFEAVGSDGARRRLRAAGSGIGAVVDLRSTPGAPRPTQGTGSVHHIAFRATGDADEMAMRAKAIGLGLGATEQISRVYFRSVYFREPEGVLFEIATDDPGFTVDEPKEALGAKLLLPPWHEARRAEIEAALPPLE